MHFRYHRLSKTWLGHSLKSAVSFDTENVKALQTLAKSAG